MEDMRAVLDAVGAREAAVAGMSEGSVMASVFAAAHPERTRSLVLYGGWGCTIGEESHPASPDRATFDAFADSVQASWGDMGDFLALWATTHKDDPSVRDW